MGTGLENMGGEAYRTAMENVTTTALGVLRAERDALDVLMENLPQMADFEAVVQHIFTHTGEGKPGRVVVTGVGKSGHIGGKIAATLASTGTPAFFVHPVEALHGDLGMITTMDTVIALSHSGESKELGAILSYCGRFGVPVAAMTSKPASTLGKAATWILNTHVAREACPLNMAPTTSTTVTLALADALAVALMDVRGFADKDFAIRHPGGKLGAQMLGVKDVMIQDNLPLVQRDATMGQLLEKLTTANLGCVGVVDANGALVGTFTDGDLKRRVLSQPGAESMEEFFTQGIEGLMSANPKVVAADVMATKAVADMNAKKVKALWAVEDGKPVGLLRLDECMAKGVV